MPGTCGQFRGAGKKGQTLRCQVLSCRALKSQSGQMVVEYILLLIIAVTIAMVITTTMVSRNEENPGFMVSKWRDIIDTIAADPADDLNPKAE